MRVGQSWAGTPGGEMLGSASPGEQAGAVLALPGTDWHLPFLLVHIWPSQEGLLPSSVYDVSHFSTLSFPPGSCNPYLYLPCTHASWMQKERQLEEGGLGSALGITGVETEKVAPRACPSS